MKKGVLKLYIYIIENKHENVCTNVKSIHRVTKNFRIRVTGVYQNFILSPYMFIIVMDEITKYIQDEVP